MTQNAPITRQELVARMHRAGRYMDNAQSDGEYQAARALYESYRFDLEQWDWKHHRSAA